MQAFESFHRIITSN